MPDEAKREAVAEITRALEEGALRPADRALRPGRHAGRARGRRGRVRREGASSTSHERLRSDRASSTLSSRRTATLPRCWTGCGKPSGSWPPASRSSASSSSGPSGRPRLRRRARAAPGLRGARRRHRGPRARRRRHVVADRQARRRPAARRGGRRARRASRRVALVAHRGPPGGEAPAPHAVRWRHAGGGRLRGRPRRARRRGGGAPRRGGGARVREGRRGSGARSPRTIAYKNRALAVDGRPA